MKFFDKVQIFWEGHKNLSHLPLSIWHYFVASNYNRKMGQIFVAFSEYLNFMIFCFQIHFEHWTKKREKKCKLYIGMETYLNKYSHYSWRKKNIPFYCNNPLKLCFQIEHWTKKREKNTLQKISWNHFWANFLIFMYIIAFKWDYFL